MAYEFKFPDVGEGITEGELIKWRVNVGDVVKEDQVIADVETDKAVVEIPSPKSGVILKLNANVGDVVKVGEVLVVLGDKGEKLNESETLEEKVEPPKKDNSTAVVGFLEEAEEPAIVEARDTVKPVPVKKSAVARADQIVGDVLAMPKVRHLAKELGVNLSKVQGSGAGGKVLESDVRAAKGSGVSAVSKKVNVVRKYDMYGYIDHIPLKGVRKAIAKNMVKSATTIPHVTHIDRADVTNLVALRKREKIIAAKKNVKLTYLPFIYKAVIESLQKHPYLNASLDEDAVEIILKKYYNIGFAIDTEAGLLVPVVKGADKKNILAIATEIHHLAEQARNRKISIGDMSGGTFTITNYGSVGGIAGTPIINHPESAILGLGKILEEPLVVDGKIVSRYTLTLSLSFDHRILDGAAAARFMNTLIGYLEDPESMLLEL